MRKDEPMNVKVAYQQRVGLFPEHDSVICEHQEYRLTGPAREALEAGGAEVTPIGRVDANYPAYDVRFPAEATVPDGLVVVRFPERPHLGIRMEIEPEYPNEEPPMWWERADWLPCPECGAALVWYEAGYVPGYRVCARPPHHHVIVG